MSGDQSPGYWDWVALDCSRQQSIRGSSQLRVREWPEAACLEERAGDVVGEVAEPKGGAAAGVRAVH